jgi:hypothetical protein
MRVKKKFFVAVIMMCFAYLPTVNAQHWYKGNLHTHSLWSDGDDYPEINISTGLAPWSIMCIGQTI